MTTPHPPKPSIAIVGAGLSGLCLAQSLVQANFDVQIFERDVSPHARRQGYRITLNEQGITALKACLPPSLFELYKATASPTNDVGYFRFMNSQLHEIFRLTFKPSPDVDTRPGQVDRQTLRSIMSLGLEKRVHFGKEVVSLDDHNHSTTLYFSDGTSHTASFVVGADGAHSPVRQHLLPECSPLELPCKGIYGRASLYQKDRASILPQKLNHAGVLSIGTNPGHAFFFTSMVFDELPQPAFSKLLPSNSLPSDLDLLPKEHYIMWGLVLPQDTPISDATAQSTLQDLAVSASKSYHALLLRFVSLSDPSYTIAVTFRSARKPLSWSASANATLMGDAIHVMPPTGGQGGNTALRDAELLARKLKEAFGSAGAGTEDVNGVGEEEGALRWHMEERLKKAVGEYQSEMTAYAFKEVATSTAQMGNITERRNWLLRWVFLTAVPWIRRILGLGFRVGDGE
jgi:2-polyprenyl-6-methoxyphenol hydroxylase-like FAD-dependent oxidoreductase